VVAEVVFEVVEVVVVHGDSPSSFIAAVMRIALVDHCEAPSR
jgi:hypothetical protein